MVMIQTINSIFSQTQPLLCSKKVKSLASPKRLEFEEMINLSEEVVGFEIYLIEIALDKTDGNQFQAAQILNLKHTTLNSKIKRYRLSPIGRQTERNDTSIGRHNHN